MQNIMDKAMVYIMQYGLSFVYAILIFIIGKWLAKVVSRIIGTAMAKAKLNETLASFLKNILYYLLLLFVCIAALNKLGIETTSFVALIGAAGLAVGLALQGSLANFAAGVMLIFFQPFKVGDEVEAGGASGVIKEIQIFSTIMDTPDNKTIIVPNAKITADKIVVHNK
ncbi:MAG TPA: mechanosensitive ion channel [Candidatus Omnitrophota bacterium]|nr:mechanosensitive ion channel [Candidatus Omnitrophota bacterium]HPT06663.1 mechanosensitive ion channel [Candidatus Omnitrophota bacterium]